MRRLNCILGTLTYILVVITTTSFAFIIPNSPKKATISTIIDTIPSRRIKGRAEKINDLLEPHLPQTTSCLFSNTKDNENNEISSKRISDDGCMGRGESCQLAQAFGDIHAACPEKRVSPC